MANNSKKLIEENIESRTFECLISNEKVVRLEEVLAKYPDILLKYKERKYPEVYPDVLILETFKFENPLTSIEIDDMKSKRALQFIEDLKEFFFVNYNLNEIYISRFRTLCGLPIGKFEREGKKIKLSDRNADLAGISYGYSLKQIVQYYFKEGLYHLIK